MIKRDEDYETLSEEELVQKAKSDDEIALNLIFDRYKKFVRSRSQMYFMIGGDMDDLIQEGMIGLFRAIRDYNSSMDSSFSSFAQLCITRQMFTAISRARRKKHAPLNSFVSINQMLGDNQENEFADLLTMVSTEGQPEEMVINKEAMAYFSAKVKDVLSKFEYEVMKEMQEGKSYSEIAETLGKSKKTVDNAIQRIKRKIRDLNE